MNTASTALLHIPRQDASRYDWLLRLGSMVIALIIFLIDLLSTLDVAIAVMYVVVILVSGDLFTRKGVLVVTLICGILTMAAYVLAHGPNWLPHALGRCVVSLSAIGITSFLALKSKAAKEALQTQVHLLHRSEAFLAEAQRLSLTGSIGLKMPGADMYWSEEAKRIFEFDHPHPTLEHMFGRTHPDDTDTFNSMIEQARAEQPKLETEHRLVMPDGSVKYVRMLACQVRDASGGFEYIGALMDVTATKNAEEALHQSQTQLANITRVTTLGELAASIAHEVNQPLAAVITNAEAGLRWLNREVPDLGEVRSATERIMSEAHRASEVIRRIRALSRKTDPQHKRIDLQEVLQESVDLVRREIQRHHVTLELRLGDHPLYANGDRVQLQQVIINLLINAMQAMSSIKGKPPRLLVQLSGSSEGGVQLGVHDNGPGVAAENLPRLFNPFFTTKPEGMGMGLSICRSIIEAHGGRIWAESSVGEGTLLSFSLPACAEDQS